ncbi:MAG: cyclic pyranopterin monophosphate synthase MoaC [Clostridia bacterium]
MNPLTHINAQGRAKMVDVTEKAVTERCAVAGGFVCMKPETLAIVKQGRAAKGDVLAVAQVAGIMAAKRTWELVPMCHPISLTAVDLSFACCEQEPVGVKITAATRCKGETGVEMEALTAVSVAALTIYDMLKAVQRDMTIQNVQLLQKSGGKSGDYRAEES